MGVLELRAKYSRLLSCCVILLMILQLGVCFQKNSVSAYNVVVKVSQGLLVGEVASETAIFWGIPFSQPPVGNWRWRRPRNPTSYVGKFWNATYPRPGCLQECHTLRSKFTCPKTISEDCLYLNIWVPRGILKTSNNTDVLMSQHYVVQERFTKGKSDGLAVMFYLHGGGFISGSGSAMLYDGRFLASRGDVIVVTTNYRLGVMGFLVQDEDNAANVGIFDQIRALKWVKENIDQFGGNPNQITVFGQSAGAESVGILMTSPSDEDLFQQAIIQSNPWSLPYRTLAEAKRFGDKFAQAVGCQPRNMTCLRSKSMEAIQSAGSKVGTFNLHQQTKPLYAFQMFGPVIDGDLIPRLPLYSFVQGRFRKMPVIIGTDKNEGYLYMHEAFKQRVGILMYNIILSLLTGSSGSSISLKYPACLFCDNRQSLSKITTDYAFVCPTRRVLFEMGKDSWGYLFDATIPFKGIYKNDACSKEVCHGSELTYVFDTVLLSNNTYKFNALEQNLSNEVQRYWTNFAKYGNPNGKNDAAARSSNGYWRKFMNDDTDSYEVLQLRKQGTGLLQDPSESKCDYWDSLRLYGTF